jgi:hypothetical protein
MANNHFLAQVYGRAVGYGRPFRGLNNALGTPATQSIGISLPSALCTISAAPPNTVVNGVTQVSIIEVLPTGLNQPSVVYSSAQTVAALSTLAV